MRQVGNSILIVLHKKFTFITWVIKKVLPKDFNYAPEGLSFVYTFLFLNRLHTNFPTINVQSMPFYSNSHGWGKSLNYLIFLNHFPVTTKRILKNYNKVSVTIIWIFLNIQKYITF